jgi:hypothetical protein
VLKKAFGFHRKQPKYLLPSIPADYEFGRIRNVTHTSSERAEPKNILLPEFQPVRSVSILFD